MWTESRLYPRINKALTASTYVARLKIRTEKDAKNIERYSF